MTEMKHLLGVARQLKTGLRVAKGHFDQTVLLFADPDHSDLDVLLDDLD